MSRQPLFEDEDDDDDDEHESDSSQVEDFKIVLGAGLEPASLSAYAPQTYVSASSTTRALR